MNAKPIPALHPTYNYKDGEIESVAIPYAEYLALVELLEDVEDLRDLHEAELEDGDAPTVSWDDVKRGVGRD